MTDSEYNALYTIFREDNVLHLTLTYDLHVQVHKQN